MKICQVPENKWYLPSVKKFGIAIITQIIGVIVIIFTLGAGAITQFVMGEALELGSGLGLVGLFVILSWIAIIGSAIWMSIMFWVGIFRIITCR